MTSHSVLGLVFHVVVVLVSWLFILFPIGIIDVLLRIPRSIHLLFHFHGLLPAQRQELLQSHDLIVELDFPLGEGAVALSWVVSTLGELADFLSDSRHLRPVVVLSVTVLVVDLLVLIVVI